jgi:4-hydroxythreonine-4-phosphate dehydrogenase
MTEYLSEINKRDTIMLLRGDKFSVVPLTTHINLKDIKNIIDNKKLKKVISLLLKEVKKEHYKLNLKIYKFLCYNPHCSENRTLGEEDNIIKKSLNSFKEINGPISADSAFSKISKKTLFISTYHDQVLIPFKALNSKMINMTLGLKYRRLSPAHGTAKDIKFKNISNVSSYIECMKI